MAVCQLGTVPFNCNPYQIVWDIQSASYWHSAMLVVFKTFSLTCCTDT